MVHARNPKQERAQLASRLRAEGLPWVDVAAAIRQRYAVNPRTALRFAHGWSQREVAEEWNRRWPTPIRTAKNISSWETWPVSGHAPTFDTLDKLAQLYECDIADLLGDLPGYRTLDSNHRSSTGNGQEDLDRRSLPDRTRPSGDHSG